MERQDWYLSQLFKSWVIRFLCVSFQAKEAIREAEENDSENAVVYFYKFKIALLEGQDDLGEYGYIITTSGNPKTSEINNSSLLCIHPTLHLVKLWLFYLRLFYPIPTRTEIVSISKSAYHSLF